MFDPRTAPALLEALPDTVVVADRDGRIAYVNPAVHTLLGHRPEELIGESLTVLMPERLRRGHGTGFARYAATGRGELVGATTQLPALHVAGHEVPVDLTISRLAAEGAAVDGALVVAVLRDASTTILLERQFQVSRYLAAIQRVTAALTEAPDADAAFQQLLPTLCNELDWDAATIWRPHEVTGRLTCADIWAAPGGEVPNLRARARGLSLGRGEGLPGVTWQERRPVVFEDLWSEPRFLRRDGAHADGVRTGVAFPVLYGDTLLGVCELFSRQARPVPDDLLDVLATAGRQIGQFLSRLRAESQIRSLAETLQRSLLPPSLPAIPGVGIAARYRAGGRGLLVGGDTYDVLPLPGGSWMVLMADVCGKGAEAAATAALARHTARAAATADSGPADVLRAVNAALIREAGPGPLRFVTACCLVLRPHSSGASARLTVAGHPRPVLRSSTGECTEVGEVGRPLGMAVDSDFGEVAVELSAGSTLVLYTDGVTEARDDSGVQFEESGLVRLLESGPPRSAEETVEAVQAAVDRHRQDSRHERDDLAVLALRC
ncbi:histidine kinase [Modestobacter caceresii]|uniref:Histidine kinase n=1 Tax=Modestobacter caceresii TaxID=1522368 RepID=A0A098Y4R3_9ACTN|nr:SpoIIE family protein phosphatase [Modestobacter caceresii]KGH45457.1 histidine kinase [Modestobacter caceresii]